MEMVWKYILKKHAKASKTETVRKMKIHRNTHTFSGELFGSKFECEECEFVSETIETMEVHNGNCCYDHFECELEMLELHLVTCEVYECGSIY